jgi:asparagine synthase (glutamine-hydrolysing)
MFLDFLPKAVWYQDEPIGEPASIPLYFICRQARDQGITVLLSGEGSDELFAGYNRHIGETASKYYGLLPGPFHRAAESLLAALPRIPILRKGHRAMAIQDFWQRYQSWHTVFSPSFKHELLGAADGLEDSFADVFSGCNVPASSLSNFDKLLWLDIKAWLVDDLLMKKDRMGMATSLEARVPFLDHRFAEMAFSIPANLKVKGFTGKYLLKKSMERLLPREIIYRKKAGFPTPISKWLAHDLRGPVTEILCDSGPGDHGYFDRALVRKLVAEHVSGQDDHGRLLFPLLNFDIWYRTFFSGRPSEHDREAAQPILA